MRSVLRSLGIEFEERAIQSGWQFRCSSGEIFNVYSTGTVQAQGKQTELTQTVNSLATGRVAELRGGRATPTEIARQAPGALDTRPPVFVVYGHDSEVKRSLQLILYQFGLRPIAIDELPIAGETLIEKLEAWIGPRPGTDFACVLLTPDDEGYAAGEADQKKYRAHQNVILELGMVLASLGRKRVAILHKGSVELPSDMGGLIYIALAM